MASNKYGKFLTILLIILIVAILVAGGVLIYKYVIKPRIEGNRKIEAMAQLDENAGENENDNQNQEPENDVDLDSIIAPPDGTSGSGGTRKKTYYQGYVMLGYITIPKTNVKEPILDQVTPDALNAGVAVLYPSNAALNQPGNVVIIGHNYRNGKFFSNNNKLSVGDKFTIKDSSGTTLTYTIYQKFQTTEQDTSFYTRNTNGAVEVTLSTCTDDAKERIIILARAE